MVDYKQVHYKKMVKWIGLLRSRYLKTVASERVFNRLGELVTTTRVGVGMAHKNVKVIGENRYFFNTVRENARVYVLLELYKFFDSHRDTLTIQQVLDFAECNLSSFTLDEYAKFYASDSDRMPFLKEHIPLSGSDLTKLRRRLKRNSDKITMLERYRNKYLAHDDLKKGPITLNKRDVRTLLELVHDVIEVLYKRLSNSSNSYHFFKEEPVNNIDWIIQQLREAKERQQQQLKNLREEYGRAK